MDVRVPMCRDTSDFVEKRVRRSCGSKDCHTAAARVLHWRCQETKWDSFSRPALDRITFTSSQSSLSQPTHKTATTHTLRGKENNYAHVCVF